MQSHLHCANDTVIPHTPLSRLTVPCVTATVSYTYLAVLDAMWYMHISRGSMATYFDSEMQSSSKARPEIVLCKQPAGTMATPIVAPRSEAGHNTDDNEMKRKGKCKLGVENIDASEKDWK